MFDLSLIVVYYNLDCQPKPVHLNRNIGLIFVKRSVVPLLFERLLYAVLPEPGGPLPRGSLSLSLSFDIKPKLVLGVLLALTVS